MGEKVVYLGTGKGAGKQGGRAGRSDDQRHPVPVHVGRVNEAADAALFGLHDGGAPYKTRGDVLVRLAHGGGLNRASGKREDVRRHDGAPVLAQASAAGLQDDLERHCAFYKMKSATVKDKLIDCPRSLPGVILSRAGQWPFEPVRGISQVPILLDDGGQQTTGYHAGLRVLVAAGEDWPLVPAKPDHKDAMAALEVVRELIAGFPFVSPSDLSVTLAAMLSAVLRATLPTCFAFAWKSPVRGSGKSKLADICAILATGYTASCMSWTQNEDENEKRLGALALAADMVWMIDNVDYGMRSSVLNSMLTQEVVSIRILGMSKMPKVEICSLIMATGNNLTLHGDLTRRFLVSHLDPRMERPELRQFAFDPVVRARERRRELVTALLTIARWGAGLDLKLPPVGSFEVWSKRVRDPIIALGLADPCSVLDELHKEDPEREAALALLGEWRIEFGSASKTTAEVIRRAIETNSHQALREALDRVAGGPGGISPVRLGKYLARIKGRIFEDLVLRQTFDTHKQTALWVCELIKRGCGDGGDVSSPSRAKAADPSALNGNNPSHPSIPGTLSLEEFVAKYGGEEPVDD